MNFNSKYFLLDVYKWNMSNSQEIHVRKKANSNEAQLSENASKQCS